MRWVSPITCNMWLPGITRLFGVFASTDSYSFAVVQLLCLTPCDLMDWSTPGCPIFNSLPKFATNSCSLHYHLIICNPFLQQPFWKLKEKENKKLRTKKTKHPHFGLSCNTRWQQRVSESKNYMQYVQILLKFICTEYKKWIQEATIS